jgi:protease-3
MPRSLWFKVFVVLAALWAPFSQADTGWQPIQETIRKSEKDTRQYQAIRLDNDMVVLLVSDPQAVKSLSALVVPVGSLQDPADHQGLAHFLEHMTLMGSQKYPQPDSLAEFLKLHGGSHNASTAPYRTAFYLEVENDALDGAVDRLADAIAAPLLDKKYADREHPRKFITMLCVLGAVMLIAALCSHPYWIISKIQATPSWLFYCLAAFFPLFGLFYWL